jgi:hypothetical protein
LFGPWTFYDVDKVSHQIQGISIIDIATRWVELCPYTSKRSKDIALFVDQNWFAHYPRPRLAIFVSDSAILDGITPYFLRVCSFFVI